MAAPEVEAQEIAFGATGPPTDSEPCPLPSSSRKFPFESTAANATQGWAVAEEPLLNESEEDYEPELAVPGFGSAGRGWAAGGWAGRLAWRAPALLISNLALSGTCQATRSR